MSITADKTLIFDRQDVIAAADQDHIAIIGRRAIAKSDRLT
jgi:hypothetical protein